jgi:hypothetical protein
MCHHNNEGYKLRRRLKVQASCLNMRLTTRVKLTNKSDVMILQARCTGSNSVEDHAVLADMQYATQRSLVSAAPKVRCQSTVNIEMLTRPRYRVCPQPLTQAWVSLLLLHSSPLCQETCSPCDVIIRELVSNDLVTEPFQICSNIWTHQ